VRFGAAGEIEYRFRRLVAWSPENRAWFLPQEPSARMRRALDRRGFAWPPVEMPARFDERTEVEA